jgi:hypothetical protein
MTKKQLEFIFDETVVFSEVVGGLRKQLINQGFSPEMAENIVFQTLLAKVDNA